MPNDQETDDKKPGPRYQDLLKQGVSPQQLEMLTAEIKIPEEGGACRPVDMQDLLYQEVIFNRGQSSFGSFLAFVLSPKAFINIELSRVKIVKAIIASGVVDINKINKKSIFYTSVLGALSELAQMRYSHPDDLLAIFQLLIAAGVDIYVSNEFKQTVFACVSLKTRKEYSIKYLEAILSSDSVFSGSEKTQQALIIDNIYQMAQVRGGRGVFPNVYTAVATSMRDLYSSQRKKTEAILDQTDLMTGGKNPLTNIVLSYLFEKPPSLKEMINKEEKEKKEIEDKKKAEIEAKSKAGSEAKREADTPFQNSCRLL